MSCIIRLSSSERTPGSFAGQPFVFDEAEATKRIHRPPNRRHQTIQPHNLSLDKGPRAGIICWFHTRITRSNHTMKFSAIAFLAVAATPAAAFGPATPLSVMPSTGSSSALSMVLEKPKKLSKLEVLKTQSRHLENPLREVRCFSAAVVFGWHCYFVCFGHFWFRRLFSAGERIRIRNCIATNANADQRRTKPQWLDDDDAVVVGLNVCVSLFGIEANRKFGTITCVPDSTNAPETNERPTQSIKPGPAHRPCNCTVSAPK